MAEKKYIVARPFLSHLGRHEAGSLAPKNIDELGSAYFLVSAGLLIEYVPEEGYDRLPPHAFAAVVTLQEARGIIKKGEQPMPIDWEPAPELLEAQRVAEAEEESLEANRKAAHKRAVKQLAEVVQQDVDPRPILIQPLPPPQDGMYQRAQDVAAEDGETNDYNLKKKDALVDEIKQRNKERDEENQILVSGDKADLVQRLVEDDLNR